MVRRHKFNKDSPHRKHTGVATRREGVFNRGARDAVVGVIGREVRDECVQEADECVQEAGECGEEAGECV